MKEERRVKNKAFLSFQRFSPPHLRLEFMGAAARFMECCKSDVCEIFSYKKMFFFYKTKHVSLQLNVKSGLQGQSPASNKCPAWAS